jgi:hypothetical protein
VDETVLRESEHSFGEDLLGGIHILMAADRRSAFCRFQPKSP